MTSLDTTLCFPPGIPSNAVVREFLRLVFDEYRWFTPVRYGFAGLDERFPPGSDIHEVLLDYYKERKLLSVAAKTDRDFFILIPAKQGDPPYAGAMTWVTSTVEAKKPAWRSAHARQVAELMRLMGAPYAQAGENEDTKRKTDRLVPHPSGYGRSQVPTVNDYSEGLAGLFWRNFFGPPFVRLLGERLATLPADTRQDLGDGILLVQPYELPTQAGTPEAEVRERELITHLGPECFYDHVRHLKPSRLPELPPTA